ncbi:ABC transporter ATP-binding protein [Methanocella arvoryzae]|uniref:ABC-type transport system, ATPase component n=1 Tax=Methanocella arvoryzae (strain DSM 22066 / NBRC 105507 / MRE50) TaxID=351160 RepID=Q0W2U1_METAR|nr:ABC transporter ATP-binding protein [Methanocella arvoryzae]CAJ37302.1 ABC-type transport system, ATPase component [Methanocella arvoryzae MRE50]
MFRQAEAILSKLRKAREEIVTIIRAAPPQKAKFKPGDLKFFWQFVRPVWKIGAISLFLVMLTTGLKALLPLTGKVFIDFVILKTGYGGIESALTWLGLGSLIPDIIQLSGSIEYVAAVMIIAAVIFGLLSTLAVYLTTVYQQELTFNLQTSLFDHVLRFPMAYIKDKQTGYLMSRVSDDVNLMQYLFSDAVTQIISSAFYILFGIAILMSLNLRLAVVIAATIPAYLAIRYLVSGRIRALSYRERESSAEVSRNMQEAISGVELVKSYATEKTEVGKVSVKLRDVIRARISRSVLISFAMSLMRGTMFALVLIIMLVGAGEIQAGRMTIGDFVAFISYLVFLSGAVNTLFYTYMSFQPAFASMDRLKEMFGVMPEFEWGNGGVKPDSVRGDVRFENVTFSYAPDQKVLNNISFEVKKGETVAIVGHSGAGKTTLVSLLLKLYQPQSGVIRLDGRSLAELDHAWLRQQISIVSQDIFLFNDTVENNIKYGRTDASHEDVERVAKKARIHDFIMSLPKGYDTLIGERGTKLSVGQRQRISIARAFLKDTPIVILDEPTSAIDPETEMYLKESLDELVKGRTTFIISHRMSLTEIADRVIVIDDGGVVQIGSYEELVAKEGLFATLKASDAKAQGKNVPDVSF